LKGTDFEGAVLCEADLSGADILHIRTYGWKIDDIQCTHVYRCPDLESWCDPKEREKYRRDFAPGEFETQYQTFPKIELIFQQGFSFQDLNLLTLIVGQINQQISSPLDISELRKGMKTSISITVENDDILNKAASELYEMYQQVEEEFYQLQDFTPDKFRYEQKISEMVDDNWALIRKELSRHKLFLKPEIYVNGCRFAPKELTEVTCNLQEWF
jgi:hypothetical protein